MSEMLGAMGISASILLPIVVLVVIVTIAAVKRGEAAMHGATHEGSVSELHGYIPNAKAAATASPQAAKPAPVPVTEEISVLHILFFGVAVFTLAILGLLLVSVINQLM